MPTEYGIRYHCPPPFQIDNLNCLPSTIVMLSSFLVLTFAALSCQVVIDRFTSPDQNDLGNYHGKFLRIPSPIRLFRILIFHSHPPGCDEGEGITCTFSSGSVRITSTDVDYSFYTQLNGGCQDITGLDSQYLHVKLSGSPNFSIALQENNPSCRDDIAPYPRTWDIVYAADYHSNGEIYIPLRHFNIDKRRTIGVAFKAFRSSTPTTLSLVEIVATLPAGRSVPGKKATGKLFFECTRPNSIAFGIDDGVPGLAQRTMEIIKKAGIKVTFFTVGESLYDEEGNFTAIYREAIARGHQVALHSMTHPKLESESAARIEKEFTDSLAAAKAKLGNGVTTKYFRAPYGTDGALTRQKLESAVGGGSKVINWVRLLLRPPPPPPPSLPSPFLSTVLRTHCADGAHTSVYRYRGLEMG